jgi:hypothetical protein
VWGISFRPYALEECYDSSYVRMSFEEGSVSGFFIFSSGFGGPNFCGFSRTSSSIWLSVTGDATDVVV